MSLSFRQKLAPKPKLKLTQKIRISSFLEQNEKKFNQFIVELEKDPLFRRLAFPENPADKVITRKRLPKMRFDLSTVPILEQVSRDVSGSDIESLMAENKEEVGIIRKIGEANFRKYFLCNEEGHNAAEVAAACGLDKGDIALLNDFVNSLSVQNEFFFPSAVCYDSSLNFTKIAGISCDEKEGFFLNMSSPAFASGRYVFDFKRLKDLKEKGFFTEEEVKRISGLIEKAKLVNKRKTAVYRILEKVSEIQKAYLLSGDERLLVAYSQRQLSEDIGIGGSSVSRAIYARSVVTPGGVEVPLSYLIPSKKDINKIRVGNVIRSHPAKLNDKKIQEILKKYYAVNISRRSVNEYVNELKGRRTRER
ncbi:MAG: hypothetical protein JW803_05745 [Endomicrobiales bacterium]|nr:hypothetical protein [Endomicrobiales bacterium]